MSDATKVEKAANDSPPIYMIDTNIASDIIKGTVPFVRERLFSIAISQLVVSTITQAELLYGVSKRGYPSGLTARVNEFLARMDVLSWSPRVGRVYGDLRALCESKGITLSPLDLMIAAHAREVNAVLVTRDRVFRLVPNLVIEDWSKERES
ncbi:type II toxin-antitoxin system VapC family toxin [Aquabacterium sp. CECT 9606]|uniref:type II toxin-antitoxin system VapC family toxin n=1 Tax=Aquabacterium sp. CECT 9606 TaxID=2845822 RepID=UPI001E2E0FF1|nr:type II toxin-antitoxin system VapC family toxin [Aquabacterium sp. CECT 9606]